MRIFLSCLQSKGRHAVPAYDFWEPYLKGGIEEAGHTWVEAGEVDWAEGLAISDETERRQWRDRAWSEVLRVLRDEAGRGGIDLFLGYLFPHMVEAGAIGEIRRMGIPSVNFFCDNVREFRRLPDGFRCFDLNWVPEFEALPLYEKAGARHIFAPMPCWISPQLRRADHAETAGVTFVGSFDALRGNLLGNAIRSGADLAIAGAGWRPGGGDAQRAGTPHGGFLRTLSNQNSFVRRHGLPGLFRKIEARLRPLEQPAIEEKRLLGQVSGTEYLRLIQQSRIALGINRVPTFRRSLHGPLTYSRLRDIEAPMMGACYLTEWTESLARFYDVGRHVEAYRTVEELTEKIQSLLADPQRRRQLRARGQEHALRELSVPQSLGKVMAALGLASPAAAGAE